MKNTYRWGLFVCISATICCGGKLFAKETTQEAAREKLLSLLSGEWVSRSLYAATKLEIAEHLQNEPKTIDELASLTSSHADSLYRILHMLAGFGIFEEVAQDVFANTDASRLLIKTNPDTLHALSLFYGEDIHKSWEALLPSIQIGTPAFQLTFKKPVFSYFKENPTQAALFQEAMKEKSKAVIKSALSTYDFSQFNSVYDIGGGQGQFLQALLQKFPNLSGTLFDLPEVIEKLKQQNPQIENKRCQLCPGDFFSSVPKGGDVYLLKSVIHDWEDAKAEDILKNCYLAMRPDSRLLLIEVVLQPGDRSVYANCVDILMLAVTGGKERNLDSFMQLLDRCGFALARIVPTTTEFSILEVRKK